MKDYQKYEKCLVGLNAITKESWDTADNTEEEYSYLIVQSLPHK
jgi:hypothetical protein